MIEKLFKVAVGLILGLLIIKLISMLAIGVLAFLVALIA